MRISGKFLASIFASTLMISLIISRHSEASYIFDWNDFGSEWYWYTDENFEIVDNPNSYKWDGHFSLPDSAVTIYSYPDRPIDYILDFSQVESFSLSGKLIDGNDVVADQLQGDPIVSQYSESSPIIVELGELVFTMSDPPWSYEPFTVYKSDQDHWLYYTTTIYSAKTSSWRPVLVSHYGEFIGRHVDNNNAPVPEPATMLLIAIGLLGIGGAKYRREKK